MTVRLGAIPVIFVLVACRNSIPEGPDLSETLNAYVAGPTGDVDIDELQEVVDMAIAEAELTDELRSFDIVTDQLVSVVRGDGSGTVDEGPGLSPTDGTEREDLVILGGGFRADVGATVRHVCHGYDPERTVPNATRDGVLNLTFTLTESGLGNVIWGEFERCRYTVPDVGIGTEFNTIFVDGTVAALIVNPSAFDLERDYLFTFDGEVVLNGALRFIGSLDFLFFWDEGFEIRVPGPTDGEIIMFKPLDDANELILRTTSGDWKCDLSEVTCTKDDGTVVSLSL